MRRFVVTAIGAAPRALAQQSDHVGPQTFGLLRVALRPGYPLLRPCLAPAAVSPPEAAGGRHPSSSRPPLPVGNPVPTDRRAGEVGQVALLDPVSDERRSLRLAPGRPKKEVRAGY